MIVSHPVVVLDHHFLDGGTTAVSTSVLLNAGDGATLRQDESIVKAYVGGGH